MAEKGALPDELRRMEINPSDTRKACVKLTSTRMPTIQLAKSILFLLDGSEYAEITVSGTRGLLITEYGIWPSHENYHLYNCLRRGHGDNRPIFQAPFHGFYSYEVPEFLSFLDCALRFCWGGVIMGLTGSIALFSHDGWLKIAAGERIISIAQDEPRWDCHVEFQ